MRTVDRDKSSVRSSGPSSSLRSYIAYIERVSPEGLPKLRAFIGSANIVGVSRTRLPIPYGDHTATFRRVDGTLIWTSQPYHAWPDRERFRAYCDFAQKSHLCLGLFPDQSWWCPKTCLVVFEKPDSLVANLYFWEQETRAIWTRIEDCLRALREGHCSETHWRIEALKKDAKALRRRLHRTFGWEAANG